MEPKVRVPFHVEAQKDTKGTESKLGIVRESIPYILVPALLGVAAAVLGFWYVAAFLFVVALFMAFFFRDPKRVPPSDPDVVVSPADGRVTRIGPAAAGADRQT